VIARLPGIESGLGTFRGAVRAYPIADGKANRFELHVLDKDPHADARFDRLGRHRCRAPDAEELRKLSAAV